MLIHAHKLNIPTIYHMDDDLLNIPIELGERKWKMHNHPTRLGAVRHLLGHVDLIYSSTARLTERIVDYGFTTPIHTGRIYCSGSILNQAELRPVTRVGYMGTDHSHDFALVVPALAHYLEEFSEVKFDIFGSMPKPEAFNRFGDRVQLVPPVQDYAGFLAHFATLNWDIGICTLADMPFNAVKANTKWVEYSVVGTAVVATRGSVYDSCMADGCGILAQTDEEWLSGFKDLTADPALRYATVQRAQRRVENEYSIALLRQQVVDVFKEATQRARSRLAFQGKASRPSSRLPGRIPGFL